MAKLPNELELDKAFWAAISTDASFLSWFLARTKFSQRDLELLTGEKWHQRWYRDPRTGKDSETDIFLLLRDRTTNERSAFHIENKPAHRTWEPNQAQNYRIRAIDRMAVWGYQDFQTVLLAPRMFLGRWPIEVGHFDVVISYEDVGPFVADFAVAAA